MNINIKLWLYAVTTQTHSSTVRPRFGSRCSACSVFVRRSWPGCQSARGGLGIVIEQLRCLRSEGYHFDEQSARHSTFRDRTEWLLCVDWVIEIYRALFNG